MGKRGGEDIDGETIMRVMMLPGSLRLAEAEHDRGLANWSADLGGTTESGGKDRTWTLSFL